MTLSDLLALVRSREATRTAIEVLETLAGIPFTVVGGWAVYAHGSDLPSVDIDIWYGSALHDEIYGAFLKKHDVQLDTDAGCERFNLDLAYADDHTGLFGTDLGCLRSDLTTEQKTLFGHAVTIPIGPDLLFSKAKAFHDRSQQWEIKRDPERLAALRLTDPEEARFIHSQSEAYWLRKAGKDLADIRFLQSKGFDMGGPPHLRDVVSERLAAPDPTLVEWANG